MAASAGTCFFLRQIKAETIFHLVEKYQIQYFSGAPVTMNTMLAYEAKRKFGHQVKMWAAGASPPPAVMERFYKEIGVEVQAVRLHYLFICE